MVLGISRITVDISSLNRNLRTERIQEFEIMKLDSFGLALRPIERGDIQLVIERSPSTLKDDI